MAAAGDLVLLPRPRRVAVEARWVDPAAPQCRHTTDLPAQGYRITVNANGSVVTEAGDEAGAFYAERTLEQLRRAHGAYPVGVIEDWPDFSIRGVMLDISRDKVPTMATLKSIVDGLADQKVNHLQLYMEHTFAYRGHRRVWRDASPLRAAEIRELDRYCRDRHIELTPNQNTLGHFERWLRVPEYRDLAITPQGHRGASGEWHEPTTLDPAKPAAMELVRSLLAELLPNFGSRRVNAGLDEPWELPPARIDDYRRWLEDLRSAPETAGRELLVWGDILQRHPSLLASVPPQTVVCEWGYDSNHPFDGRAARLAAAGVPFWVSPGTGTWSSIGGRLPESRANVLAAAEAGRKHGARGLLMTDWGDRGHLQHWAVSELPVAYAAAVSWALDANRDIDLERAASVHLFSDRTGGVARAASLLGTAQSRANGGRLDRSVLADRLYEPGVTVSGSAALDPADVAESRKQIGRALALLAAAKPSSARGRDAVRELSHAGRLLELLTDDIALRLDGDGSLGAIPGPLRASLERRLAALTREQQTLWLRRNRTGGLRDSMTWLSRYGASLRAGVETPRLPETDVRGLA